MSDEEEKKDSVISLADFKKTAKELGDETKDLPTEEEVVAAILKMSEKEDFKSIVVVGEKENGKLAFFSSCYSGKDIVYFCSAFTNLVLSNSLEDTLGGS